MGKHQVSIGKEEMEELLYCIFLKGAYTRCYI